MKIKTLLLPEEITQAKNKVVRIVGRHIQLLTLEITEQSKGLKLDMNDDVYLSMWYDMYEASKQVHIIADKLKCLHSLLVKVEYATTLEELYEISVPDYLFE